MSKLLYPYIVNPETDQAFVFSALDCDCTKEDFQKALDGGKITQQYHDALLANVYAGAQKPQNEYWLQLT